MLENINKNGKKNNFNTKLTKDKDFLCWKWAINENFNAKIMKMHILCKSGKNVNFYAKDAIFMKMD